MTTKYEQRDAPVSGLTMSPPPVAPTTHTVAYAPARNHQPAMVALVVVATMAIVAKRHPATNIPPTAITLTIARDDGKRNDNAIPQLPSSRHDPRAHPEPVPVVPVE